MRRLKIAQKIFLLNIFVGLIFMLVIGWVYGRLKHNLYEGRQTEVRHAVNAVAGVIDYYVRQANDGSMSLEQAQTVAKGAVAQSRYDGNNYFWINDSEPKMIMHPIKPELDGQDLSQNKDPNGKALFVEMVKVVKARGEGDVDYFWPKPGFSAPVPKVSYVKLIPEWGWIIGSGLYLDDVEAELNSTLRTIGAVALGVFAVVLVLVFWVARSISQPIHNAIRVIEKIAQGDTDERLPMGVAVNCGEVLQCGKAECPSHGKEDHCWVTSGSYATIKHCPKALAGEDCRTCKLYGARNEAEELGSIINALANTLAEREALAMAIANGDLTREVEIASEKDALGKALQRMVESLRNILGQIQTAGEQIASGSSQVSDSSQSLSQGATEQASSLEEITSSMTELGAQTRHNAENATQANQLASQARTGADKGNEQMRQMVSAMAEINESGQNISKIIKVIDEIAFQTNLLALNAAVEAARAGQHGKGFAVVAEEVRNLAGRSAKAARETAELIEGSVKKAQNGADIADRTAKALDAIVADVSKVTDLVGEIAASSNEQAQGIAQINQGLAQIDKVTQQNTASAEQSAAAAEQLSSQATQLRQMLKRFRIREKEALVEFSSKEVSTSPSPPKVLPSGWGDRSGTPTPPVKKMASKAHEVIALDDSEFGRY